eukprot:TRINITY_DN2690_c0_g1_i13.p1 TRINITY_DN2690_c0_g1~~TRINITY_DN2690_c0_g1_i13.p1  ORF type:complete len:212 (+),score=64.09 TRINITY_DN2690_c0_g1_i13:178-813(+)
MEREKIPERPLTPFFLYLKEQRANGASVSSREGGEKWNEMTSAQKKPFIDKYNKAREKYDAYLEAEGIPKKRSASGKKVTSYNHSKISAIMEHNKSHKDMSRAIVKGITKVVEAFVCELADAAADVMRSDGKRTVTVEVLEKALDAKKYRKLTRLKAYEDILEEASKAMDRERSRRRRRSKSKKDEDKKPKPNKKKCHFDFFDFNGLVRNS